MPAPSSSEPTRPTDLPTHAVWDGEHRVWRVGSSDEQGRWHGQQFIYRGNGSLQGEFVYVAGKPDGKFRRYHPDGELSIEGEYRLGTPVGTHTTYRSAQVNDEAVHTCCMPPNAWRLVTQYPDDGRLLEDYFDAGGLRLLHDGSPHPEPPASVPLSARFAPQRPGWIDGRYERGELHGGAQYWSVDGALQEVASYKHGKLDGLRERFSQDRCVERRMYKAGQPDGCAWELVAAKRFEDVRVAAYEGSYERGKQCGKWRYLDDSGQIVTSVDMGPVVDEIALDDAVLRTITPQDTLTLDPAREHVRRVLYAAHNEDDAVLLAEVNSVPQLLPAVSEQITSQLRSENLEPAKYVARLLHWLMRGARAEHVFRALGAAFVREPPIGLQLLKVSLRLAPYERETRAAEILLFTGLGKLALARQRISELAKSYPDEANELSFNLRVTYPTFDYWPSRATFPEEVSPELPTEIAQPLGAFRLALSKAAMRLGEVRRALLDYGPEGTELEFELPPDLSHWCVEQPTSLDSYTFECSPDGSPGDVVKVHEQVDVVGYNLPDLMLRARTEWTTLCWLAFASGQDASTTGLLPSRLEPQNRFAAALTGSFQELYRVTDQLRTAGLRSRSQGLADCAWEGRAVSRLSQGLLVQAFVEMRERRAALYFAADDECRSVWQDDLRAT